MKRFILSLLGVYLIGLNIGPWLVLEQVPALNNSVRITNNYTGALTSHPFWFARFFKEGELDNYCRPYVTPSDTGTRAAASTWQCTVLNRWRDASVLRTITGARAGSPSWTVALSTLASIVLSSAVGTITFPSDPSLALSKKLVLTNAPSTADLGATDNAIIHEVTDSTHVKYLSRATVSGTHVQTATYNTSGVEVAQKIDPLERSNSCIYTSANHGFLRGETVTIASVGGVTPSSASQIVTMVERDRFATNATCSGTYTSGGTATGPDNGSVKFALVALVATNPASGYIDVDFVNSTDPCSSGNESACNSAGLDRSEMLAISTWNADLDATADVQSGQTATLTTSARAMLTAWNETQSYCGPRYWARGPVMTKLILEHGCDLTATAATTTAASLPGGTDAALPYDFGWEMVPGITFSSAVGTGDTQLHVSDATDLSTSPTAAILSGWSSGGATETMTFVSKTQQPTTCNGNAIVTGWCITVTRATTGTAASYASGRGLGIKRWRNAPSAAYKSLHPRFDLTFITGGAVKISAQVHNEHFWKEQNIWYSIDLKTGSTPSSTTTRSTFKHTHSTSWNINHVDGTDPEFYCATAGSLPACTSGTRTRRYLVDYNTPYIAYTGIFPEYRLHTGQSTKLNAAATGFNSSDKGEIASGVLGSGTWSAPQQAGDVATGSIKSMDGQEAFPLNDQQAMWLQNWSAAGYQIIFCDTCPGGAGNAEVQRHIPWHWREDDDSRPRYIMPGFTESAFGRNPSLYTRPSVNAQISGDDEGTSAAFDKRRTACSQSAAPALLSTTSSNTAATGSRGWPCWPANTAGLDGWGVYDSTSPYSHQQDAQEIAYFTTGEPRYLDGIQAHATWNTYQEFTALGDGRQVGKSWANAESTSGTYNRGYGGWMRSVLAASIWTPNVPMFGASVPPVETYYWNEKVWDAALSKEGYYGITTGWFSQMYPGEDLTIGTSGACGGTPGKTSSIWNFARCSVVNGKQNPLGIMGYKNVDGCLASPEVWLKCDVSNYLEIGFWYTHNVSMQWSRAHDLGMPMFDYSRARNARLAFALFKSTNWNPYMLDLYQSPMRIATEYVQTLTEMFDGLKTTGWTGNSNGRNDADFCHTSQCGLNTHGYGTQWIPDIASMKDLRLTVESDIDGCSGSCDWDNTWSWVETNMIATITDFDDMVKYNIVPRSRIPDLSCTPSITTASCTYTPPTTDACTYRIATTEATDTLDATDTGDGGSGLSLRTLNLSSLTANTHYYLRATCGQVVSGVAAGTGRAFAEFTTTGGVSATSDGRMSFQGRVRIGQ